MWRVEGGGGDDQQGKGKAGIHDPEPIAGSRTRNDSSRSTARWSQYHLQLP